MLGTLTELTSVVLQEGTQAGAQPAIPEESGTAIGLGIAVGLAGLGAGVAERGIGAAAVGAIAEDSIGLGTALVLTVLPETLVLLALVVAFVA
ncbi:F0F1 ATP synthase subunit C [Halobacteriales archaeon SW_5_70_135]|nr:MAG: F0F1 ATP synthase subunit C [Halobacteriales archaeon SW_5_70_135]